MTGIRMKGVLGLLEPAISFRWTNRSFSRTNVSSEFLKLYTKTGDAGTTALFTGERRSKKDLVFEALGTTDELSSHLALAREYALEGKHPYTDHITKIQCILQDISSLIATPKSSAAAAHLKRVGFAPELIAELEDWIDDFTVDLPPLNNFILPGGGKASSCLHIARTVCRRAERCVVPLVQSGETSKDALIYLNRLSDYLFTVARVAAQADNREECIYTRATASINLGNMNKDPSSTKTTSSPK